ncbi:MAG: hypothetical protein V1876_03330 [Candidatus Peregrinibacteria bacterium]
MESLEQSFAAARADPARRADFLRTVHEHTAGSERLAPFIKEIVYDTRIPQECLECGRLPLMSADIPLLARFHQPGSRSVVRVWPRAFDDAVHGNLDAFLSTLFDHEGWHAREYCECPETIAEYVPLEHLRKSADLRRLAHHYPSKQTEQNSHLQMHCELRAYDRQLLMIRERHRKVQNQFIETIEYARQVYLDWINRCVTKM